MCLAWLAIIDINGTRANVRLISFILIFLLCCWLVFASLFLCFCFCFFFSGIFAFLFFYIFFFYIFFLFSSFDLPPLWVRTYFKTNTFCAVFVFVCVGFVWFPPFFFLTQRKIDTKKKRGKNLFFLSCLENMSTHNFDVCLCVILIYLFCRHNSST